MNGLSSVYGTHEISAEAWRAIKSVWLVRMRRSRFDFIPNSRRRRIKETIEKSREKWWKSRARSKRLYVRNKVSHSLSFSPSLSLPPASSIYREHARASAWTSTPSTKDGVGEKKYFRAGLKREKGMEVPRRWRGGRVGVGLKNGQINLARNSG